jgi:hypothetical protein
MSFIQHPTNQIKYFANKTDRDYGFIQNSKDNSSQMIIRDRNIKFDTKNVKISSTRCRIKSNDIHDHSSLNSPDEILHKLHFGPNLMTIKSSQLPIVAEIFSAGEWKLCLLIKFLDVSSPDTLNNQSRGYIIKPPPIQVLIIDTNQDSSPIDYSKDEINIESQYQIIDFGQVTTIWPSIDYKFKQNVSNLATYLSTLMSQSRFDIQHDFPVNSMEQTMQTLYNDHFRIRSDGNQKNQNILSKKDISRIISNIDSQADASHLEQILKKAMKTGGSSMSRLVNSINSVEYLYQDSRKIKLSKEEFLRRWLVTAMMLSMDAQLGGRFKRLPSIFVSAKIHGQISTSSSSSIESVTVLNGGFVTVDMSVRAGTEGRKLAERTATLSPSVEKSNLDSTLTLEPMTAADERILYRLECLALGESLSNSNDLNVDVRGTLSALDLPQTPLGAQKALIKMGRWSSISENISLEKQKFNPWSQQVLNAANNYVIYNKNLRQELSKQSRSKGNRNLLEGRINLTSLPTLCIDAKGTSFRDDAIGLRKRSSTGRMVIEEASRWEILIHIADVSDIFGSNQSNHEFIPPLREAAESRGVSRYDLPLGPLHLLPPVALESLCLTTRKLADIGTPNDDVNRCVTVWVYIDERNGTIIDSGVERTLISSPFALTYDDASSLIENRYKDNLSSQLTSIRAMLTIIDRNLGLWTSNRKDIAGIKREQRLQVKELVANELAGTSSYMKNNNDGKSFTRTRGHRLVDSALDCYGTTLNKMLSKKKVAIPRVSGGGSADRGGRIGSAPLRRYIDGISQRQVLSVLCDWGGPPLTREECTKANLIATDAINKQANFRSVKLPKNNGLPPQSGKNKNMDQLRSLSMHLKKFGFPEKQVDLPAISTGRENEVVIKGTGILAKCVGVKGSLKPGENILVRINKIDLKSGSLKIRLATKRQ